MAEIKAEVSRLKDELGKAQKAIASQRGCIDLIDEFLELEGADRQGITARQRISEALTGSRKPARFTMLAKFQTWLTNRD